VWNWYGVARQCARRAGLFGNAASNDAASKKGVKQAAGIFALEDGWQGRSMALSAMRLRLLRLGWSQQVDAAATPAAPSAAAAAC